MNVSYSFYHNIFNHMSDWHEVSFIEVFPILIQQPIKTSLSVYSGVWSWMSFDDSSTIAVCEIAVYLLYSGLCAKALNKQEGDRLTEGSNRSLSKAWLFLQAVESDPNTVLTSVLMCFCVKPAIFHATLILS